MIDIFRGIKQDWDLGKSRKKTHLQTGNFVLREKEVIKQDHACAAKRYVIPIGKSEFSVKGYQSAC
jgi:hypothetical protein